VTKEILSFILGNTGLVVAVPQRAAVKLWQSGAVQKILERYPADDELRSCMLALRVVAQATVGTANGTPVGAIPAPPTPLEYLSTAEAAQRARMSSSGIRKAIASGKLTAELIGNRWVISAEALEKYINH
jgi:excisionase family DNA binding protein